LLLYDVLSRHHTIHLYSQYKDHIRHEHSEIVRNRLINTYEIFQTNHLAVSLENWFTRRVLVNTGKAFLKESNFGSIVAKSS